MGFCGYHNRVSTTRFRWGLSLPRVGNIFDVTNPGITIIAYLRHAARSTRIPRHNAGERQRCHPLPPWRVGRAVPLPHRGGSYCRKWRAERAVPRRGTIVVSPTQLVPEVLAVWGSDFKEGIACRRYAIMVANLRRIFGKNINNHHIIAIIKRWYHRENNKTVASPGK